MIEERTKYSELRERQREEKQRKLLIIRNIINIVFMLVAVVGMIWTFIGDREVGLMIVLCSIPLKMTSTALRFLK